MSYRSPSNPRTPSQTLGFKNYQTNPGSAAYSPISNPRSHVIDNSAPLFSHDKSSRPKFSESNPKAELFQSSSSLETREKRLEDQFQSLLDRCNKSKEFIQSMQNVVYGSKSSENDRLRTTGNLKSLAHSNISTATRPLHDNDQEHRHGFRAEKKYSNNSRVEHENDDYEKLENEVLNLKRSIVDRLQNKGTHSSKGKIKFKDLGSEGSSDEDTRRRKENKNKDEWNSSVLLRDRKSGNGSFGIVDKSFQKSSRNVVEDQDYDSALLAKEDKNKAERSLNKLKNTLREKEKLQQDNYINLKSKCRELQNVLKEYVSRVYNLEESVKRKEEQIRDYEVQVSRTQEDLIRSEAEIEESRRIEDGLRKNEAEIKNANLEYKLKTAQQEERIEELEEDLKDSRERHRKELEELLEENDALRVEFEVLKEKMTDLRKNNEKLEKQEQSLKEEVERSKENISKLETAKGERDKELKGLSGDTEKLRTEKGILEAKLVELKEVLRQNNERTVSDERKHEDEMRALKEEREKKLGAKKQKIKVLRAQLAETEGVAQKVIEEKKFAIEEKERVSRQSDTLERDFMRSRDENKLLREEM